MSKRDGYEPGMPAPRARLQYWFTAASPTPEARCPR
jgi:hypothetical protein